MTPRSPAGKVARGRAVVAGGGDEDGAGGPGVVDGGLEGGGVAGVAEGHEDDVGARIGGVHDARDDVAVLAGAIGAEDGHRQDRDTRVGGAGDAEPVIGLGGDDAGHPGAVAVRIGPAVRSIQNRGAGQQDTVEVRMASVDTGVENRDGRGPGDGGGAMELVPADVRQ